MALDRYTNIRGAANDDLEIAHSSDEDFSDQETVKGAGSTSKSSTSSCWSFLPIILGGGLVILGIVVVIILSTQGTSDSSEVAGESTTKGSSPVVKIQGKGRDLKAVEGPSGETLKMSKKGKGEEPEVTKKSKKSVKKVKGKKATKKATDDAFDSLLPVDGGDSDDQEVVDESEDSESDIAAEGDINQGANFEVKDADGNATGTTVQVSKDGTTVIKHESGKEVIIGADGELVDTESETEDSKSKTWSSSFKKILPKEKPFHRWMAMALGLVLVVALAWFAYVTWLKRGTKVDANSFMGSDDIQYKIVLPIIGAVFILFLVVVYAALPGRDLSAHRVQVSGNHDDFTFNNNENGSTEIITPDGKATVKVDTEGNVKVFSADGGVTIVSAKGEATEVTQGASLRAKNQKKTRNNIIRYTLCMFVLLVVVWYGASKWFQRGKTVSHSTFFGTDDIQLNIVGPILGGMVCMILISIYFYSKQNYA